jgi:hypothetical protein|tara:strand:+ start:314 stop:487 length:174 start_codon:yes stop_codon:yes gene_type:complete
MKNTYDTEGRLVQIRSNDFDYEDLIECCNGDQYYYLNVSVPKIEPLDAITVDISDLK